MIRAGLAIVLLFCFSGCFSSMLYKDIISSRGGVDSIRLIPAPGLRVMHCPRVGKSRIYRVKAAHRTLYFNLDDLLLTDSPKPSPKRWPYKRGGSHRPGPVADTLELVMGTSPDGFFPSDVEGPHPSLFLHLPAPEEAGSGRVITTIASNGSLLLLRAGRLEWSQVLIQTDAYLRRRDNERALRKAPWFLLTVPGDIATGPLQLMILFLFRDGFPMGCPGGCT